jgi:hypothetical protein
MPKTLVGLALVGATLAVAAAAAEPVDLRKADVCATVSATEVAHIAGGSPSDTRRFNAPDGKLARCLYLVSPPGGKERIGWVVELLPAADFDAMRPYIEQPVRELAGVGDGAYVYKDPDSGRFRLYAHRRGGPSVSVTGPDDAVVRRIAVFALSLPALAPRAAR